jgi:hypothetical protein
MGHLHESGGGDLLNAHIVPIERNDAEQQQGTRERRHDFYIQREPSSYLIEGDAWWMIVVPEADVCWRIRSSVNARKSLASTGYVIRTKGLNS